MIDGLGVPIIPNEVREEVSKITPIRDHHVRDPDPADGARDQAVDIFHRLKGIRSRASQAETYKRHETTWNNHVHTPLLEMVFKWEVPYEISGEITEPQARVEPMMSATIDGDSIPLRNSEPGTLDPACSVAVGSAFLPSDSSSQHSETSSNWSMSQLRSRSAKVDYVVVLDVPLETPLQTRISWTLRFAGLYPHINQTSYEPVRKTLIAIAFEMKTEVYETARPFPCEPKSCYQNYS
jgi:hypothetical protein